MTPMTPTAVEHMQKLWATHNLPPVSFEHWSAEYARDVWDLIQTFTSPDVVASYRRSRVDPHEELLRLLIACDVFDDDPAKQQWVPKG